MYILGIETSCDETSAAVLHNNELLSLIISNQTVHQQYGGVVPELASRAHQQNIVPVVEMALRKAGISKQQLNAIAFTLGPGLPGSLMVGVSFAKSLAWALQIPIITVDHLHAHILVHFITESGKTKDLPSFPLLALVVSGGHTLFVRMEDHLTLKTIGKTIDDAAGEVFDKAAKMLNLPYPGGPVIDKHASQGNPFAFTFAKPKVNNFDFSFSGLKTSILYFLRDKLKEDPTFIDDNLADLCASIQHTIVEILLDKIHLALQQTKLKTFLLAGGVAANSYLRKRLTNYCAENNIRLYLPEPIFTTDNGAMIAIAGYYKYLKNDFAPLDVTPYASGKLIF
ncbi:MAG: tRNA (adenosine(37)-N6)-threonylcarbamoyltransferase complex transferase subunit TsaD [Bacteroidales bacterium]|nr:tRNA (adenosine(37)-N6)-threonylcarbamoyltransferase complex transferase subunit TsaD [Bacteroidales bacterium]